MKVSNQESHQLLNNTRIPYLKVGMSNMPKWTLYLSGMWLGQAPKTNTKRDTWLKEIRLHAENVITNLGSTMNVIRERGLYDHLMTTRISTLTINKVFTRAPKYHEENGANQ